MSSSFGITLSSNVVSLKLNIQKHYFRGGGMCKKDIKGKVLSSEIFPKLLKSLSFGFSKSLLFKCKPFKWNEVTFTHMLIMYQVEHPTVCLRYS